jgi:DNA-binding beta-propeller fold protein YncE
MRSTKTAAIAVFLLAGYGFPALAQIAVSANDGKAILDNGVTKVISGVPDTIAVIDLTTNPPKLLAEIEAPASVVGPPLSVAVAADESFALVTAAMKAGGADQVPDNRISVIDLKSSPPKVLSTVESGNGVAGISINKAGTLALAANRSEGSVSVFTVANKTLTLANKIKLGDEKSGPSHVAITPDGTMALVTRDGDSKISVLSINGNTVEYTKRDINAGLRPYGIDVCAPGQIAVVANIGLGQGDADTVSVIDLTVKPPRVIDTVSVGQTPEGIICSPDGKFVAVTVMNGSNKATSSPFHAAQGDVQIWRVEGKKLTKAGEAKVGNWSQGAVFSNDNKTLLVQNMVQKELQVFEVSPTGGLKDTGTKIKLKAGPAGIRTAAH